MLHSYNAGSRNLSFDFFDISKVSRHICKKHNSLHLSERVTLYSLVGNPSYKLCRGLPHLEVFDKNGGEGVLGERLGFVKIVEEDEGGEDLGMQYGIVVVLLII